MRRFYRMKFLLVSLLIAVFQVLGVFAQDKPDGFASVEGRGLLTTTGGEGGEVVTVTTLSQLRTYAGSSKPYIIHVDGKLESPSSTELSVASNKTIVGVGDSATLINIELHLINVKNVIIRNLTIRDNGWVEMEDGDGLQADNCHHIWIDHCHFHHNYDGCIDLRFTCDYITISWTKFSDHNKTLGIGWTDELDMRKTIHHCWFDSTMRRNASLGAGYNHVYNVYERKIDAWGMHGRGQSRNVIENCFFENSASPLEAEDSSFVYASGNMFENCSGKCNTNVMPFNPKDYYDYTPDTTALVRTIVSTGAGPHAFISKQYTQSNNKLYTVTAMAGDDHGSVTPASLSSYEGDRVRITALAADGFQFDHWNIDLFGNTNPATVVLTNDMNLVAYFRVARFTVFTTVEGKGSVTPSDAVFQIGSQATVNAIPASGWVFDHWEGDLTGNTNPATLTVTKDLKVMAHFRQLICTLNCTADGSGSVTPASAKIDINTQATLTATPVANWVFDHWSGDLTGTENPVTIKITGDMDIVAHFRQVRCNVTTRVLKGKGTVDPQNADFDFGQQVTLTAKPDPGWKFEKWIGNISGTDNPAIFSIDKDMKVSAYFVPDTASNTIQYKLEKETEITCQFDANSKVFRIKSREKGAFEISVFSIVGEKVYSKKEIASSELALPMGSLNKGIYLIRIESNGIRRIEKFFVGD